MDPQLLGRPDDPHLELAIAQLHCYSYWPQSLCDECTVPPKGGPDRVSLVGSNCTCVGLFRYVVAQIASIRCLLVIKDDMNRTHLVRPIEWIWHSHT